jgi:hypothetical protein
MAEFSYRNNKISWKELLVFIVVESLVVVWGSGAWTAFENPYQRIAIVYAMASVALELILHVSKLAFIILGWDK